MICSLHAERIAMGNLDDEIATLFLTPSEPYKCPFNGKELAVARKDLCEERDTREQTLQEFTTWIQLESQIANCRLDYNFLLRFLRAKKFCISQAKVMLERYLAARLAYPQWYQGLDILDPNLQDLIQKGFIFALPERDLCGRRVIFGIGAGLDPSRHTTSHTMRAMVLTFETLLEDEANHLYGFTYIFDQKDVGFRAATLWSPNAFRQALRCSERALPMRHKQCHFVHLPGFIRGIYEFFKTFLSQKLRQRLLVHPDIESLSKHIPLHILPREYGGLMPLSNMIELWKQEVMAKRSRLLALDLMLFEEEKKESD
uniref:CRAL-TRIO domain-containing protein n=1 Tax=Strigamia maritima TaxID=126957 RepID=T1IRZ6_STRMM